MTQQISQGPTTSEQPAQAVGEHVCLDTLPVTHIASAHRLLTLRLHEVWDYRELLYFLTWRDVKVRYKQAALGVFWVILQPVLAMVVFSAIFGKLAKMPSDGIPYPIFSFAGLLPWQLFSGALTRAGLSLVGNVHLLTKVYFPRVLIPMAAVIAGLVDFSVAFLVLLVMMAVYKVTPSWTILFVPYFVLLAMLSALAVGLWLAALNVVYRDVQHILPFLVQAWMFASPVAYSSTLIPTGPWRVIYSLNPVAGVIQGFRWALLGGTAPDMTILVTSTGVVLALLVSGLIYFKHMERTFADVV